MPHACLTASCVGGRTYLPRTTPAAPMASCGRCCDRHYFFVIFFSFSSPTDVINDGCPSRLPSTTSETNGCHEEPDFCPKARGQKSSDTSSEGFIFSSSPTGSLARLIYNSTQQPVLGTVLRKKSRTRGRYTFDWQETRT